MSLDRYPDWYTVVRRHWRRTTGFLLASREPCLTIRDQEIEAVKGRALVSREIEQLIQWQPPESWVLGIILCPGDTIDEVVAWCRNTKADPARVWFYLHPDTYHQILELWEDAGFEADQVDYVSTLKELHKLFGLALNDQVYADWNHLESKDEGDSRP